jgi:hypothetical protein
MGGMMDRKLKVWLSERQLYFGRFGVYLIGMSLLFVGYAQATESRCFLSTAALIVAIIIALDIVPVSLRLEELGKELRSEVGLHRAPLSSLGGIIFGLYWVGFWIYLAREAAVSPYVYITLAAVNILVTVGVVLRQVILGRKRT